MGGEQKADDLAAVVAFGSSPRGRGTVGSHQRRHLRPRFIPAWAGNSTSPIQKTQDTPVHPRVGGEQPAPSLDNPAPNGSSPRGRGTGKPVQRAAHCRRFIPAWAGNSNTVTPATGDPAVHPRVGGEQQPPSPRHRRPNGSSPRGRGTARLNLRCQPGNRFIPAWAGNRKYVLLLCRPSAVHPRVGGEQT